MSTQPPSIREVLRTLHDSDRRHAPPFVRPITRTPSAPRLHRGWWAAGAAVVATAFGLALWLRPTFEGEAPPLAWSDWRSPTAALLYEGSGVARVDRFVSPTRTLSGSLQLSSGGVR